MKFVNDIQEILNAIRVGRARGANLAKLVMNEFDNNKLFDTLEKEYGIKIESMQTVRFDKDGSILSRSIKYNDGSEEAKEIKFEVI
jgi:hypothetical protein